MHSNLYTLLPMCYFIFSFWQFLLRFWVWLCFIEETEDAVRYKPGIIRVWAMVVYHFWANYSVRKVGSRRWSSVGSSLDFTLAIVNVHFVGKRSKEKTIAVEHIGSLSLLVEVAVHLLNAHPKVCLYPGLPAGRGEYPFCPFPMMVCYLYCTMKSGKNLGNNDF